MTSSESQEYLNYSTLQESIFFVKHPNQGKSIVQIFWLSEDITTIKLALDQNREHNVEQKRNLFLLSFLT